jgi:replicative DNA helicase
VLPDKTRVRTFDEILADYSRERSRPEYAPLRLGFGSLDADLRGISAGQVCGVAARTAVGKSWALATIIDNVAARADCGSLILSIEMPGLEWAERQLAITADVAPEQVEQWAKDRTLGSHSVEFLERMANTVVCEDGLRLRELPALFAAARSRLRVPLRLIVVDYLGLLEADGRDAYERASALGRGLKQLAKAERVAIVVAIQVSRAGGDGSEPVTLAMLRDSGVLEESLDFLLGCWRPGKAPNLSPPDAMALRDVKTTMRYLHHKSHAAEADLLDGAFAPVHSVDRFTTRVGEVVELELDEPREAVPELPNGPRMAARKDGGGQ